MYQFEELDDKTRKAMLQEFDAEEDRPDPYRSPRLSPAGRAGFSSVVREALSSGNETSLAAGLARQEYWNPVETYVRSGTSRSRRVNFESAAKMLAITEFNAWYVRGLARRLLNEGVGVCEVYRAESAREPRGECLEHEGQTHSVQEIYDGHRARYWPSPGNPSALSIPVGPNCHHTIRRLPTD